jgi:hypothetical protein
MAAKIDQIIRHSNTITIVESQLHAHLEALESELNMDVLV